MNAPSASGQAAKARDRIYEDIKARLEIVETQHRNEVRALTDRVHTAEGEIKDLRTSNDRLNDSVDSFRRRIVVLEEAKDSSEQTIRVLRAKLAVEESRLNVATADLEVIAPGFNAQAEASGEAASAGVEVAGSGPAGSQASVQAQALEATRLSEDARDSAEVKDAVGSTLFSLCRVKNLNNVADKHYPHVPMDHPEWPHTMKPDGTRENHMRFDFEQPCDAPVNQESFERWVEAVRTQGHIRVAGAKPYLDVISEKHLRERVKKRYDWEKRAYLKIMKGVDIPTKNQDSGPSAGTSAVAAIANPATAIYSADEIKAMSAQLATMTTAVRQGFQETKLETRTRKHPHLTGEAAKYLDAKYDTVLTLGAQSEDDYEVESINGHAPRKTGRLVSREWEFASDDIKHIACKAAIDAVPDPKAPTKRQAMPTIRGPPRPGSPRANKKTSRKLRRRMIKPEVLAENPVWITSGRVVEDDAINEPTRSKKRKAMDSLASSSVAGPSSRGKEARETLARRQQALNEELGGVSFEDATQ